MAALIEEVGGEAGIVQLRAGLCPWLGCVIGLRMPVAQHKDCNPGALRSRLVRIVHERRPVGRIDAIHD